MFRYQLLIEYLGTNYKGWQIQKKNKTIQGILQDKIRKFRRNGIDFPKTIEVLNNWNCFLVKSVAES